MRTGVGFWRWSVNLAKRGAPGRLGRLGGLVVAIAVCAFAGNSVAQTPSAEPMQSPIASPITSPITSPVTLPNAPPTGQPIAPPVSLPITLDSAGPSRNIAVQAQWWLDVRGQSRIDDVAGMPVPAMSARFDTHREDTMYALDSSQRLWARIDLMRPLQMPADWVLSVPLPLIDGVTLYQRDPFDGAWLSQSAGDKIAVSRWGMKGRYPHFRLNLSPGLTTFFIQIQGSTPMTIPLILARESVHTEQEQLGYLGLGMVLGSLLLLVAVCFAMGYTYRDRLYFLYGLYACLMMLAVAAYTGLAAQLLWNDSPVWADASQGSLAFFAGGAALAFINKLLSVRSYSQIWYRWLVGLAALGPLLGLLYLLVERPAGVKMLALYTLAASGSGLWVAWRSWRRGDGVGLWVLAAYVPLVVMVLLAIGRALGWLPVSWLVQYGVLVSMVTEVPLLMVALNLRSRERHTTQTRAMAMATQDALTGLLAGHIFKDRTLQAVRSAQRHGGNTAVVLVRLVNYKDIAASHGAAVAEQSVLRSVIKLRRVLRDVDAAGRVDQAVFGLLLEGVASRDEVTQRCARLIALGLMPLKGLKPDVTLQFQFAAVLLREHTGPGEELLTLLADKLNSMSARTRRPIRFLQPIDTAALPLDAHPMSELPPDGELPDAASSFGGSGISSGLTTR